MTVRGRVHAYSTRFRLITTCTSRPVIYPPVKVEFNSFLPVDITACFDVVCSKAYGAARNWKSGRMEADFCLEGEIDSELGVMVYALS